MILPAMGTALVTWIVAIIAPGPDVLQILRVSTRSRRAGVWCALGIMVGNSAWIILSLAGLSTLVKAYPVIFSTLKIVGGAVLCWMGWGSLRGGILFRRNAGSGGVQQAADQETTGVGLAAEGLSSQKALRLGVLTNLSNPKALLFFGAVFATFVHPEMGAVASVVLAALLIVVGVLWFTSVALLASVAAPLLARYTWAIDLFSGVLFLVVGAVMLGTGLSAVLTGMA